MLYQLSYSRMIQSGTATLLTYGNLESIVTGLRSMENLRAAPQTCPSTGFHRDATS